MIFWLLEKLFDNSKQILHLLKLHPNFTGPCLLTGTLTKASLGHSMILSCQLLLSDGMHSKTSEFSECEFLNGSSVVWNGADK